MNEWRRPLTKLSRRRVAQRTNPDINRINTNTNTVDELVYHTVLRLLGLLSACGTGRRSWALVLSTWLSGDLLLRLCQRCHKIFAQS
jgi:hypothetical protein